MNNQQSQLIEKISQCGYANLKEFSKDCHELLQDLIPNLNWSNVQSLYVRLRENLYGSSQTIFVTKKDDERNKFLHHVMGELLGLTPNEVINLATQNGYKKKISSMFLHQENKRYMYNAIDSLFYDIEKLNQRIIELNQSREQYAGLFKFFNNIHIILKDGRTHHFDGDYNQFHQFVFENLFEIKSITIKEKEIQC